MSREYAEIPEIDERLPKQNNIMCRIWFIYLLWYWYKNVNPTATGKLDHKQQTLVWMILRGKRVKCVEKWTRIWIAGYMHM